MDALLDTSEQLSFIFNWITGVGLTMQVLFILLVVLHTPKEMAAYKYTFSNTLLWSLLIGIHFGLIVRPVSFLPLPVCLITGWLKRVDCIT
jgi:L-cystine uptake protein TcyP (sodium:dicarboxylate symporter family)